MNVFVSAPTNDDIEKIECAIGEFPAKNIQEGLSEFGIEISVSQIPQSFTKYFAVMAATCSELRGKKLVDFGCGLGVFVAQASKLGMDAEGIDVFTEYKGRCLEAAKFITRCIATPPPHLTQIDFLAEDSVFDADFVTSMGMLEHIHGEAARNIVLERMMRALRPGGHLILTCGPNIRFPVDFFHYGPKFVFYHCLPTTIRGWYLRIFASGVQNLDPTWLNGMSVAEIKRSLAAHGGEVIDQLFPLWVELAKSRYTKSKIARGFSIAVAKFLTKIKAEPVIIIVARKSRCKEAVSS